MINIRPREYFTIVRGLPDHTDAGTYYVRAVIRNAKTDAIIETVNLTDKGNRRFSYPWQAPEDPSGEGFYILITTFVYTDSGYTTKAENYGEEFSTYLVQDRINPRDLGPIGPDIDYKKIAKMIKEEVSKIDIPKPKDIQIPKQDDSRIVSLLTECKEAIASIPQSIKIPVSEKVDFSKVLAKLEEMSASVAGIENVDIAPVVEKLSQIEKKIDDDERMDELSEKVDDMEPMIDEEKIGELVTSIESLSKKIDSVPYVIRNAPEADKPKPKNNFDL